MKTINLKDFLDFNYFSNLKANQNQVAWVNSKANLKDNNYKSNIWLKAADSTFQLTNFDSESAFFWYQDQIVFSGIRGQDDQKQSDEEKIITHFYAIKTTGGEAVKLFSLPLKVLKMEHLTDGKFVFVAGSDLRYPDWHLLGKKERLEILEKQADESGFYEIDDLPWWGNGLGFTNQKRNRLYIYDIKNKQIKAISGPNFNVLDFDFDEDKKNILFYGNLLINNKYNLDSEVVIYNLKNDQAQVIFQEAETVRVARFYKTGVLLLKTDRLTYGLNEHTSFYYLENQKLTKLIDFDYGIGSSVGSDIRYGQLQSFKVVQDTIYFTATINHKAILMSLKGQDLNRELEIDGSIEGFDVSDDYIYLVALYQQQLQELYQYDLKEKEVTKITKINQDSLADKYLATPKQLSFKKEQFQIDGFVLEPFNYDENQKYPAILNIHGGPKTVYGEIYYHEMQYWASQGYFVLYCNPRGSDGKGNKFADIRGKYGTIDYDDIMEFTDLVLESYPSIDKNRLGVTGGSYGGFMTNWIITQTDRFQAAATQRSISNWISFAGTSDIGPYFAMDQQNVTDLYGDYDKLWHHSPLKYIKNAKTPTLVIHSDQDYRCWIPEGMQIFTALKYLGIDTKLVYFKGENHELSRSGKPKNRIKRLAAITEWFNKYLK